jgi:hypothetical protein
MKAREGGGGIPVNASIQVKAYDRDTPEALEFATRLLAAGDSLLLREVLGHHRSILITQETVTCGTLSLDFMRVYSMLFSSKFATPE